MTAKTYDKEGYKIEEKTIKTGIFFVKDKRGKICYVCYSEEKAKEEIERLQNIDINMEDEK